MAWGRSPRYCCTNDAGRCAHALADSLFSQAQHAAWRGVCQGVDGQPGCGHPLRPGKVDDRRLAWIGSAGLASAALACAALLLRVQFFPAPLADVAFAAQQSRVDDAAGRVVLEVRRTSGQTERAQLRASFVDGTAKAGDDYQIPGRVIVLQPGQTRALISIPILPDTTLRKGERFFSVVLDNVLGQPRHTVVIAPRPTDATAQVQLEQMVLGASRIGADIAGFVVKRETMDRLLPELRGHDKEFQEIRQQMRDATDNLVRAREGYLQAVHGLQSQPPQQVLSTIDRLQADLKQRNFMQQARVLPVLARQYRELVDGHSADMDRWTTELGQTIERLPDNRPRTPTV